MSALEGELLIWAGVVQSSAFIEGKDDVGADFMLNLH